MIDTTTNDTRLISGEELARMPASQHCELVEGRIIPMSPTGHPHGEYESIINYILRGFVKQHKLGRIQVGEVGVYTRRNPDTVRAADVLFISHERYAQVTSHSYLDVAPDLIVEVLSPADRWLEVMDKLREYFSIGVRLVWIANPKTRSVFVYRSLTDSYEVGGDEELTGADVLPGFAVPVVQFFET